MTEYEGYCRNCDAQAEFKYNGCLVPQQDIDRNPKYLKYQGKHLLTCNTCHDTLAFDVSQLEEMMK